jgi:SAM-dependent methyltransferase
MMSNSSTELKTIKPLLRELMPPFFWRLLRRISPMPHPIEELGRERTSDYYDAKYVATEAYTRHYADCPYFFLWCVLIDRLRPAEIRCLLDIGCGPGQFAAFLHDRGLGSYVGMDFSNECVRMARLACPGFKFVCEDALTSELFDSLEYDVVVATEFLEHIKDDLALMDRIRPGTRVYASVPNFSDLAHIRYFRSKEEVHARYGSGFNAFRVDEFPFGSGGMCFFLFEGVRAGKS